MSRSQRRLDQIKQKIPIMDMLADYGYKIHLGGTYQEQQFQCDLHGDGRDGKPSARAYPATNQWYCFACGKSRDAVETVRAKEGLEFTDALGFLEAKYKLPNVPYEDDDSLQRDEVAKPVHAIFDKNTSFATDHGKIVSTLNLVTELRTVPMDTVLAYWEAVDKIAYQVREKVLGEVPGRMVLTRLYDRLMEAANITVIPTW